MDSYNCFSLIEFLSYVFVKLDLGDGGWQIINSDFRLFASVIINNTQNTTIKKSVDLQKNAQNFPVRGTF